MTEPLFFFFFLVVWTRTEPKPTEYIWTWPELNSNWTTSSILCWKVAAATGSPLPDRAEGYSCHVLHSPALQKLRSPHLVQGQGAKAVRFHLPQEYQGWIELWGKFSPYTLWGLGPASGWPGRVHGVESLLPWLEPSLERFSESWCSPSGRAGYCGILVVLAM